MRERLRSTRVLAKHGRAHCFGTIRACSCVFWVGYVEVGAVAVLVCVVVPSAIRVISSSQNPVKALDDSGGGGGGSLKVEGYF